VITESLDLIDKGFTGIKFSFSWWKDFGKNLKEDMGIVRKIRTEIGYDIDMMISENAPNRGVSKAIRIAKALEEFDLLFWEDALPRGEIDQYAALSAAVDLPIEVGEKVNNQMLKYFILRKAVDAINPEITNTCLSETKKLADLAYLQGIMTYPHNHGSILSVAAITQLVASMPDGDLIEYRTSDIDDSMTALLLEKLSPEKGYIEVPQKPGLGIELDQNVVKKLEWDGSKISDIDSKIHDYPRW
jgi:L-alanine-DL-glutamate epimerase-like enolase superfamily enzyme